MGFAVARFTHNLWTQSYYYVPYHGKILRVTVERKYLDKIEEHSLKYLQFDLTFP